MKKRLLQEYQRLSLIKKLSIPLTLSFFFGLLLSVLIVKQVGIIDKNTILLKNDLIPALEKSTNNRALLKKISENLTFAILAGEEDMLSEISDNMTIEKNLEEMILNKNIFLYHIEISLHSFKEYFKIATSSALKIIEGYSLSNSEDMKSLLMKYNSVEENFSFLNSEIEIEISNKTNLIERTSKEVIYFTIIYVVVFFIVLFYISYLIYKDFNRRINGLSRSLDALGLKKSQFENDDTLGILSKNIKRAVEDYSIIEAQREALAKVNKNVGESIEYAALFQEAILPSPEVLESYSKDWFVCWKPRDTVGGDIYFISELKSKNEIIVMVIDAVGHGVSGAFLTILVKAIETHILAEINGGTLEVSPAKILQYFNKSIKTMLKQNKGSKSNAGFDGGVLYFNRLTNICTYAGAKTPLYIIKNNQLEIIKSDRKNVGFIRTKIDQEYTDYNVAVESGTKIYIATDGIIDQEGRGNILYGKERFEKLILSNHHQSFKQQKEEIRDSFLAFKGSENQSDDVTILGIKF